MSRHNGYNVTPIKSSHQKRDWSHYNLGLRCSPQTIARKPGQSISFSLYASYTDPAVCLNKRSLLNRRPDDKCS
ncbi:unnamed protein product [Clavelina lepadiformis]|uniref:Uncharacterized protein n=1 Tax=Clavelina lepadiformis TaxID=159417 RepID=A0ABP0GC94_CLALP